MIENVGVGVSGKLVFLEAIQPLIFFSSQSTIVKEVMYQKSSMWLHFDSRDTTMKILKNSLIFCIQVIVSPLLRVSYQYKIGIFLVFCQFFHWVSKSIHF